MSKYNYPGQGAEGKARVVEQHRHAAYLKTVSSRLKPLDWSASLGIRKSDIDVFVAAAVYFEHIIAVRYTNKNSLAYIGQKPYTPKPIDCKIKTAEVDVYVAAARVHTECGGLVVDPEMVGFAAFPDAKKLGAAMKEWTKFLGERTASERVSKIFPRHKSRGFYAVDTDKASRHYGCVMLSEQNVPSPDFSLDSPAFRDFKRNHMNYLHGDYDLYGLIDIAKTEEKLASRRHDKYSPALESERLHGMPHIFTEKFKEIQLFLNNGIGVDMIQHAGQDNIGHKDDTLYVFYPDRSKYTLHDATADAIRDIYDVVFQQEVKR